MDIQEFQNYIDSYIQKFSLLKYFKFNCQVKNITYFKNQVLVYYENNLGENNVEKFDKLIISTGLNQNPKYKEINGLDSFNGDKAHTHDIYTNQNYDPKKFFKDKNILIVGGGESSFDIGHEAVKYGKKVYLHTDNDVEWFPEGGQEVNKQTGKRYNKCFKNMYSAYSGKGNFNYFVKNKEETSAPNDTLLTRNEYSLNPLYSEIWQNYIAREIAPGNYQKKCTHGIKELCKNDQRNLFAKYLVKRTNFLCDIKENKVKVLRNAIYFNGNQLNNKGRFVDNIDLIIFATGYRPQFEYLPENIKNDKFIKNIIPKNYPNLAFIGFTRPTMGSILIIAETQAMWTMLFFEKKLKYKIRKKSIFRSIDPLNLKNKLLRHLVINNYYIDDLAKDMKNYPSLIKIFFTDRNLWYYMFYGMAHPINYRLKGEYYDKNAKGNLKKFYQETFVLRNEKQQQFVYGIFLIRFILTFLIILAVVLCIWFLYYYRKRLRNVSKN